MKRVVIENVDDTIDVKCCTEKNVYLIERYGEYGIICRDAYDADVFRVRCISTDFTNGREWRRSAPTISELIIKLFEDEHTVYQFTTFRAAMQYYIEQTKEVEGE